MLIFNLKSNRESSHIIRNVSPRGSILIILGVRWGELYNTCTAYVSSYKGICCRRDLVNSISCPLYYYPYFILCFLLVSIWFCSCCSRAQVLGATLVHEFNISVSHLNGIYVLKKRDGRCLGRRKVFGINFIMSILVFIFSYSMALSLYFLERVDEFSFFDCSSPLNVFLYIEFNCTFYISSKY